MIDGEPADGQLCRLRKLQISSELAVAAAVETAVIFDGDNSARHGGDTWYPCPEVGNTALARSSSGSKPACISATESSIDIP